MGSRAECYRRFEDGGGSGGSDSGERDLPWLPSDSHGCRGFRDSRGMGGGLHGGEIGLPSGDKEVSELNVRDPGGEVLDRPKGGEGGEGKGSGVSPRVGKGAQRWGRE